MQETYIKVFEDENRAWDWMVMKNKACERAGNFRDVFCFVDHPEGHAIVDLNTAIELGSGYTWSYI